MLKKTLMPTLRQRFVRFSGCGAVHEICQGTVNTIPTLHFALAMTTLCNANDKLQIDNVAKQSEHVTPNCDKQPQQSNKRKLSLSNLSGGKRKQKTSRLSNEASVQNNRSYIKDFIDVRCFGTQRFIDNLKTVISQNCIVEISGDLHCTPRTETYRDKNFASTIVSLDQNKLRCGEHFLRILKNGNSIRTLSQRHLLSKIIYSK